MGSVWSQGYSVFISWFIRILWKTIHWQVEKKHDCVAKLQLTLYKARWKIEKKSCRLAQLIQYKLIESCHLLFTFWNFTLFTKTSPFIRLLMVTRTIHFKTQIIIFEFHWGKTVQCQLVCSVTERVWKMVRKSHHREIQKFPRVTSSETYRILMECNLCLLLYKYCPCLWFFLGGGRKTGVWDRFTSFVIFHISQKYNTHPWNYCVYEPFFPCKDT